MGGKLWLFLLLLGRCRLFGNRQIIERDLMQASEVGRLPRDEAIVLIAGANPIRDKKYRLEGHPRYGMLAKGR